MLSLFPAGSPITDIGGNVRGGPTVLVDTVDDLDALLGLCVENRHGDLNSLLTRLDQLSTWLEWFEANREQYRRMTNRSIETQDYRHPHSFSDVERLIYGLMYLREIWGGLPAEEAQATAVTMSLSATSAGLNYEAETPGLFFHHGSLELAITPFVPFLTGAGSFTLSLGLYGIGIILRLGFLPSIQGERLVETLRDAARSHSRYPDLPRLESLDPKLLQEKKGVIILLHGLFSTDLRTFDSLIQKWGREYWDDFEKIALEELWRQTFPDRAGAATTAYRLGFSQAFKSLIDNDYLITGWPHDTLSSIDTNARDLFELIASKTQTKCPPLVFVCHSRGGLVARKTAVLMQEKPIFADKVKLCVTFGTPHKGADLASHPLKFVAAYVAIMSATRTAFSVIRALAIYKHKLRFEGVEDLLPESVSNSFLSTLRDDERRLAPDGLRSLPILPIGSSYEGPLWFQRALITGLLNTHKHDLVVRALSSVPETYPDGALTSCSHGEYFTSTEADKPHFKSALNRIRESFDFKAALLERVKAEPILPFRPRFRRLIGPEE